MRCAFERREREREREREKKREKGRERKGTSSWVKARTGDLKVERICLGRSKVGSR